MATSFINLDHFETPAAYLDVFQRYGGANAQWLDLFGPEGENLIGQPFVLENTAGGKKRPISPASLFGQPQEITLRLGGASHRVRLSAFPLRAPGSEEEGWLLLAQNIQGPKAPPPDENAEHPSPGKSAGDSETDRTLEALRKAELSFRSILEVAPVAIVRTSSIGAILGHNPAFAKLLAAEPGSLQTRLLEEFGHPSDREKIRDFFSGLNGPGQGKRTGTFQFQDGNGKLLQIRLSISRLAGEQEEPDQIAAILEDLTGFSDAREELEKKNEALAQSTNDMEQFLYMASHDLQAPLRTISNFIQLFEQCYSALFDEDGRQFMFFINEGAVRMQTLLTDLLAFSRLNRVKIQIADADIGEVVESCRFNLREPIEKSGAQISCGAMPVVRGDFAQLVTLFQNLLDNAIKFRGANTPEIRISAAQSGSRWTFSVADNGIGLDTPNPEQIFWVFKRLHPVSEYPGSGLGLSICQRIVESHGGTIGVSSTPGEGSVFTFTLPGAEATE
ncbi:MAG TPA: ATP-binding protein [Calditrichia bacterium]|nr:ATP-binding protein [Calditrichia bacterium]